MNSKKLNRKKAALSKTKNRCINFRSNMSTNNNSTVIPDDIISTINDFKRSKNGSMINIHGKEYAQVSHRIAVARRNLGGKTSDPY